MERTTPLRAEVCPPMMRLAAVDSFAHRHCLKSKLSEDGTKIIPGKFGHIYEYDERLLGVIVMPDLPRPRYWGFTRASLIASGLTVVQDGDGEGAATFDPSDQTQAKAAVTAAGVRRRRQVSPEQRERRIAYLPTRSGTGLSATGARRKPRKVGKARPQRPKVPRALSALRP